MGTRPSAAGLPPFGARGMARRRSKVIQAPREGAPKSRRPPLTDGGFFLPVHGLRVLKRRFFGASQPETSNKKPPWLLGGLKNYPGVFLPNGRMVPALADEAISTAAHISRHNKNPGTDGVGSRDTVAGVNTTSLSECDGHRCRARSHYRSIQRGRRWALLRLVLLTKTIPLGSQKKLGCHPQPEVPKSCLERTK